MRKKLFAILMSAMMVITFMPTMAFAESISEVLNVVVNPGSLQMEVDGNGGTATADVDAYVQWSGTQPAVTIEWATSDSDIATPVSKDTDTATITAKKAGHVTITAIAKVDGVAVKSGTCDVTVNKTNNITGISFSESDVEVEAGDKITLSPTIKLQDDSIPMTDTLGWTSSSESNATVTPTADGTKAEVTLKENAAAGATITVKAGRDASKTASITIVLKRSLKTITLDKTKVYLKKGDSTNLTATLDPITTTQTAVTWTSSNAKVTVTGGTTTSGKNIATVVVANDAIESTTPVTITASAAGKTAQCEVYISPETTATGISLTPTTYSMYAGDTYQLVAKVLPENTTDKLDISWNSSDSSILEVDSNGKITAKNDVNADTEVTITASVAGKPEAQFKKECKVTVKARPVVKKIVLSESSLTVAKGNKSALTATLEPANSTGTITWSVANGTIAEVSPTTGATVEVEGLATGTTKVYALVTYKDAAGLTKTLEAECPVTVTEEYDLKDATVTLSQDVYTYDGEEKEPTVTVKAGTTTVPSTSYAVDYSNNINASTTSNEAVVTITAKTGDTKYVGSTTKTFTINPLSLTDSKVSVEAAEKVFTGSAITLDTSDLTVKYDGKTLTDLTGITIDEYVNNTNAAKKDAGATAPKATLTGSDNFTGSKEVNFTINQMDIADATVTATVNPQQYTGSAITLTGNEISMTYNGNKLVAGTDFEIDPNGYKNNVDVADKSATNAPEATLIGSGNYTGTKKVNFTITTTLDIADCYVELTYTKMSYTGKARTQTIVVYDEADMPLTQGVDYKLTYANNTKIGVATVVVYGLGKYAGSSTYETFQIVPKKVTIKTPSVGSKSVTVKWTKLSSTSATGYQVWVSTSSSFGSGTKKISFKGYSTTKKVVKSLKKGKRYYVKVRAYKTVNGEKYWGLWSSVKKTAKVK